MSKFIILHQTLPLFHLYGGDSDFYFPYEQV